MLLLFLYGYIRDTLILIRVCQCVTEYVLSPSSIYCVLKDAMINLALLIKCVLGAAIDSKLVARLDDCYCTDDWVGRYGSRN